jgi:hypothetical protein
LSARRRLDLFDLRILKEAMRHFQGGGAMDGEMGLTPEELARLTPEELAELRQVYAEGHAAGYAVGYAESSSRACRTRWPIAGLTRSARCRRITAKSRDTG